MQHHVKFLNWAQCMSDALIWTGKTHSLPVASHFPLKAALEHTTASDTPGNLCSCKSFSCVTITLLSSLLPVFQLAKAYGMDFFETSAFTNHNITEVSHRSRHLMPEIKSSARTDHVPFFFVFPRLLHDWLSRCWRPTRRTWICSGCLWTTSSTSLLWRKRRDSATGPPATRAKAAGVRGDFDPEHIRHRRTLFCTLLGQNVSPFSFHFVLSRLRNLRSHSVLGPK